MVTIEIMDGAFSCPRKCPTCPIPIQSFQGSQKDKIVLLYELLQNKLIEWRVPITVSSAVPFSLVNNWIEKYSIVNRVHTIAAEIDFHSDTTFLEKDIALFAERFPNTYLVLTSSHEENIDQEDLAQKIKTVANIFFTTSLKKMQVAFSQNALSFKNCNSHMTEFGSGHRDFFRKIYAGGVPEKTTITESYQASMFEYCIGITSTFRFEQGSRIFSVVKRMLSQPSYSLSQLDFFKDNARKNIDRINYELLFTLTPLGVRVNHTAFDIANIFLWITYDELFHALNNSKHFQEFCFFVTGFITKGLIIAEEEGFVVPSVLTEESIFKMSQEREFFGKK